MLPAGDVFAFTMLAPGIPQENMSACLECIANLDSLLLPQGGKRYLSGWLGDNAIDWCGHYGDKGAQRAEVKRRYDPHGIFCSHLLP